MTAGREDRDWLATLIAVQEGRFPIPLLDDAGIRDLLRSNPRIAMVGASSNPGRPSHGVMRSLRRAGYDVVAGQPARDGDRGAALLPDGRRRGGGDRARSTSSTCSGGPDLCVEHAREAVAVGARCLWLQLGIANAEAARIAHEGGLAVVMDRCTIIEHRRLAAGPA